MTSEKAMLSGYATRRGCLGIATGLLALHALGGCGLLSRAPAEPRTFASPYPAPKLWAVAPFRNESGVSLVDGAAVADRLTQQLQQAPGIDVLPVNRVLEAMSAEGLAGVGSVHEAEALMRTLGTDGLLVGTVTAWDPYDPPKIGVVVQLYRRQSERAAAVDSRRLTRAATSDDLPGLILHEQPIAQAGGYFDAANGTVRKRLRAYAHGRAPDDSPAGWRRYLLNMDLYSEFVAHELMRNLFAGEWRRLTGADTHAAADAGTDEPPPNPYTSAPPASPLRELNSALTGRD